jgi:hypothetical protein
MYIFCKLWLRNANLSLTPPELWHHELKIGNVDGNQNFQTILNTIELIINGLENLILSISWIDL